MLAGDMGSAALGILVIAQASKDGIVVGGSATHVLLQAHLGGSLAAPLFGSVLTLRLVAIGTHGIAQDTVVR